MIEKSNWSKWVLDQHRFGDWNVHCEKCGAILEDGEVKSHNWYYCYHCGSAMENWATMADEAETEWFGAEESEEENA